MNLVRIIEYMPMKKFILIIILFFAVHLYSQEIPLPLKCFPLNETKSEDIMSGQMADVHGDVYALEDRFEVKGKAVSFGKEDSYLSFPMTINIQEKPEFTFTYWAYIGTDSIAQAFWAKDDAGNLLLGMGKKGTRAVLNIYHKDSEQDISSDIQWMWNDSNFSKGVGWYFVAITYTNDGTYFYMVPPKGEIVECYSAFTPDWELLSSICIGTMGDTPAIGMDDFKVYGTALSKEQISILYQSESQLSVGNESLINVETNEALYSSTWYLHCVGLQETLQYVLQNRSDFSFISADVDHALTLMSSAESNEQKWTFHPLKNTTNGKIFIIENVATGMNLTDMYEGLLQQVQDNTDSQQWYIGLLESTGSVSNAKKNEDVIPLSEKIYYDKNTATVCIRIKFPEVVSVKIRLVNSIGMSVHELFSKDVQFLEKDIYLQMNGIYLVVIESDNYQIVKKIFVNN